MFARSKYWKAGLAGTFVLCIAVVNLLAFSHAKAMIKFTDNEARTSSPEDLDFASKIKVLTTGVNIPRPRNTKRPEEFGLTFKPYTYPGYNNAHLEAWHIPADKDDVIFVLFHGYASSKDSLLPLAEQLNQLGYSSFLVDFHGSGGSTGDDTTVGFHESTDVLKSLSYVQTNWPHSKIVLYGQSMGGAAVLRSTGIHKALPDGIIVEATYDTMLSTVKNRFSAMKIPATPLAQLLLFWGGWQAGFDAFTHNPADYAKESQVPALVLHGAKDPRVTTDQAKSVFDQLGGWKQFESYPQAGHESVMHHDLNRWQENIQTLVNHIVENQSESKQD